MTLFFISIAAVTLIVGGIFIGRHIAKQNYIKELESSGWQWVEQPYLGITVGLNRPPFGIGLGRGVDDQVIGRSTSGVPFQAFRYWSDQYSSRHYVIAMRLPGSLPECYVFPPGAGRAGVTGLTIATAPLQVVATEPAFGEALNAAIAPLVAQPPVDASGTVVVPQLEVDHDQLVMLDVPKHPASLRACVEWLAAVQTAIVAASAGFAGEPAPAHLAFHGREHWEYVDRDDSMLAYVQHSGGGSNHTAVDVVKSDNFGLPFIRLTHKWETTYTTTDSEGHTTTHTQYHDEQLCEFRTTFPFRDLFVNWGMGAGGDRVAFESAAFNQAFTVRSTNPRFASDVIHPRQMEYLMAARPVPFSILSSGAISLRAAQWGPAEIDWACQFLHGFFGRVPDFCFKSLGAWPRPIAEVDYSAVSAPSANQA